MTNQDSHNDHDYQKKTWKNWFFFRSLLIAVFVAVKIFWLLDCESQIIELVRIILKYVSKNEFNLPWIFQLVLLESPSFYYTWKLASVIVLVRLFLF